MMNKNWKQTADELKTRSRMAAARSKTRSQKQQTPKTCLKPSFFNTLGYSRRFRHVHGSSAVPST
jgi:hypothetical protein